jgi:hypothetical protein
MQKEQFRHRLWDRLGISASALCLVHCVALPFLLVGMPALARFESSLGTGFHIVMAVLVTATVVPALRGGFKRHGDVPTLAFGGWGLTLILIGLLAGDGHGGHDHGSHAETDHHPTHDRNHDHEHHHDHDHEHEHNRAIHVGDGDNAGHDHSLMSRESILTMLGSVFVVTAHVRNLSKCRESC